MTNTLRTQAEQAFERSQIRGDFPVSRSSFLAGYEAAARELARVTAERDAAVGQHHLVGIFNATDRDGGGWRMVWQAECECHWRTGLEGSFETARQLYDEHLAEMAAREVNREH